MVEMTWIKLPPKTVQINLQTVSCIQILKEWERIAKGELKPSKSIHVSGLMKRIKKRGRL